MARTVSIGCQDFETIRRENYFYIDKTSFLSEWWENGDSVTLIARPRRFGKTLNISMTEKFFSVRYAGRGELFEGLSIWEKDKYRKLQGTYPVISLSFANVKENRYELCLTNREVRQMFRTMVKGWFRNSRSEYNGFIKALLVDDIKAMNHYMNKVALNTFSSFDTGNKPSETSEPERFLTEKATTMGLTEPNPSICFYHGFVLGLLVELSDWYTITSNRESGFGRYDVMLEPKKDDDGIILEFKV